MRMRFALFLYVQINAKYDVAYAIISKRIVKTLRNIS